MITVLQSASQHLLLGLYAKLPLDRCKLERVHIETTSSEERSRVGMPKISTVIIQYSETFLYLAALYKLFAVALPPEKNSNEVLQRSLLIGRRQLWNCVNAS